MTHVRILISLILTMVSAMQISALVRYDLRNLTSREITHIIQDSKGFLWIGTDNGLNRFDGWTNVTFTNNPEDSTSLKSNIVESLFNDAEGNLWVGSGKGLQRYEQGSGKFESVAFPETHPLSVRSIIQRSDNELLIVSAGFGTYSVDTKTMKATPLESLNRLIGTKYSHLIKMDPLNRIWIGARDGRLLALDKNLNKLYSTVFPKAVHDIAYDRNNNLYVSTLSDIYLWDASKQEFRHLDGTQGWSNIKFLTDSKGNILIHTLENGVFRMEDDTMYPEDSYAGLKGEGILDMLEDRDGNIWTGTRKGGLAMQPTAPELFNFREIPTAPSVKTETIFPSTDGKGIAVALSNWSIMVFDHDLNHKATFQSKGRVTSSCTTSNGHILLGYDDGRIMRYSEHGPELLDRISSKDILAIAEDNSGRLYASISGEGLKYRNSEGKWISVTEATAMATPAHLGNDWISVIAPGYSGEVWLGHFNGIDIFNPDTNRFTENNSVKTLRSHIVYDILPAKDKTIWIGTNNGLYHLFPDEDRMDHYGPVQGMPGNIICGIEQANNGDIWCTTNNGLSRIRYADNKTVSYLTGNGLGERDYRKGMLLRTSGDKLFAAGFKGLTAFYPDAINDTRPLSPPILTRINLSSRNEGNTEISYADSDKDISAEVLLNYFQNTFSLEFSTFDFLNSGSICFEYRIPSLNKEWHINPPGDNKVVCNYMEPGSYILEIRATDNGQTSPATSILIRILPPWYLTIWAKTVYAIVILLITATVWYVIRRYRQQRRKEEMAEEKFKMLYNFAHELRSPVTLITSPLTSLIREEKDENKANTFRMIQRNGYRITNLVNQMLDVRRIEKGQMNLLFSETDLKEYIGLIIDEFRLQAETRRIDLSFSAPDGRIDAYIDPDNFDKVIVNLIGNALKFTPDGGSIDVTLRKTTGPDGKEQALVEVADTGSGIPPENLKHIFDRFYQVDRKSNGFGIGLNLSKMLVDMHQGTIRAFNRNDGSGARFDVTLPLGRAHLKDKDIRDTPDIETPKRYIEADESMALPEEDNCRKGNHSHRILIADDDDEIRNYLKKELGNSYKVITASDGEEAYAIALEKNIDLIVSDIMMPKSDGFELLRKIRSNADTAHIPIILLTTSEDFDTRMSGWEKGADAYLTKPFRIEELRQLCASLISGRIRLKGRFSHGEKIEGNIDKVELKGNDELLLERITKAINENIGDSEFGVEELAESVGLSRVHLHRKMKALLGLAPRDFLKSVRLKSAAEMLLKRNTNISQVGYSVGFSSPGQFSESFKKYYGCSPSEYIAKETGDDAAPVKENAADVAD